MDIGSTFQYPSNELSNFAEHEFVFCGVRCSSMEGFLQSLKFSDVEKQREVCGLVGIKAKRAGSKKKWHEDQLLYWEGVPILRTSQEYQNLITAAYNELAKNDEFRRALIDTGSEKLIHTIGRSDPSKTVLTEDEFCGQLERIRSEILADL